MLTHRSTFCWIQSPLVPYLSNQFHSRLCLKFLGPKCSLVSYLYCNYSIYTYIYDILQSFNFGFRAGHPSKIQELSGSRFRYHTPKNSHLATENQCLKEDSFLIGMFPKIGVPQNGWFIMENPMNKWMIWVVKTTIFGNIHWVSAPVSAGLLLGC